MPGPGGEVSCAEVNGCSVPTAGRTATGLTQSHKPAAVQPMESCDCGVVRTTARETLCVIAGRRHADLAAGGPLAHMDRGVRTHGELRQDRHPQGKPFWRKIDELPDRPVMPVRDAESGHAMVEGILRLDGVGECATVSALRTSTLSPLSGFPFSAAAVTVCVCSRKPGRSGQRDGQTVGE